LPHPLDPFLLVKIYAADAAATIIFVVWLWKHVLHETGLKFRMPKEKNKIEEFHYFRVTITYSDNESSGRVFHTREQAERYAARQKKSPVVKSAKIEPFVRVRHRGANRKH
jgi:hypothetical protein